MAYLHQVDFTIKSDQLSELQIGNSLERVLGFLRTLLPNFPGFITTNAFTSVENTDHIHLQISSLWDKWDDLQAMQDAGVAEENILREFETAIELEDLEINVYQEVD